MKTTILLFTLLFLNFDVNTPADSTLNDSGNLNFELVKEKIIIPVQINGKTYKFLIDTGGIFEISEGLQKQLNFSELEPLTIVDINRNETELKTVSVPAVSIGNWTFKNRKAIVSDLHHKYPYSCFGLDGMIGRDFFNKVILHFDYASNTFRITDNPSVIELDKSNRTKLKLSHRGLPEIKLEINGKKKYIEFDSGAGDFYSPKTSDAVEMLKQDPQADILTFQGMFSFGVTMDNVKRTTRYIQKIESFQMANTTFRNFYSQFSKVSAPRIGAAILKHGKVTVDFKNGWFYYDPYSDKRSLGSFESFGFDVAIMDGHYMVKYTLEGSDAEKSGLRSGDFITMIDNVKAANVEQDCEGYLNGYSFMDKQKITITFLDQEQNEKSIDLKKVIYN